MIKDCVYDDEVDYSDVIDEYEDEMLSDEEFESGMKSLKSWI